MAHVGFTATEASVCAHAVAGRETVVVQGALADPRFSGHPLLVDAAPARS